MGGMDEIVFENAKRVCRAFDKLAYKCLPREIADVVVFHARGAGVAGVAAGWAPGFGSLAAATAAAGFVWTMYARINNKLGLPIGAHILKSVASALCINLATASAASLAAAAAASLVPVVGSALAATITGTVAYGMLEVAGILYLKLLAKLANKHVPINALSAEDMKEAMREVCDGEDVKGLLRKAEDVFKQKKKAGEFDKR